MGGTAMQSQNGSDFPATASWSPRHWFATILVGASLWALYSLVGPGDDYFRCYTWMVMEPERLPQVVEVPWTQNPPWLATFMAPFVTLPGRPGYIAFMGFTIAAIIYACYKLGGRPIPTLLSAHVMWILWWGQIEAWGVLAIVLGWFALRKKSWPLMTLALAWAAFKPQIGFVPVLALWWWSGRDRWKSMLGLAAIFVASLAVWGPWPVWYVQSIPNFVGNQHAGPWSASLGLLALPLFLPALLLKLDRPTRIIALTATAHLASPYLPYYSTLPLLTFAIPGWGYLFGFLGYLPSLIGTRLAWNAIVLLPLLLLVWIYLPHARQAITRRFGTRPELPPQRIG